MYTGWRTLHNLGEPSQQSLLNFLVTGNIRITVTIASLDQHLTCCSAPVKLRTGEIKLFLLLFNCFLDGFQSIGHSWSVPSIEHTILIWIRFFIYYNIKTILSEYKLSKYRFLIAEIILLYTKAVCITIQLNCGVGQLWESKRNEWTAHTGHS